MRRVLYYCDHREGGRLFGPIVEDEGAFLVQGWRLRTLSDAIAIAPKVKNYASPEARALLLKVQERAAPDGWSGEIVAR